MSSRLLGWAFRQKTGSAMRKLLLVKLCDNANDDDDNVARPSIQKIAAHMECSVRCVRENMAALERGGFISVIRTAENGASCRSKWRINADVEREEVVNQVHRVVNHVHRGSEPGAQGGSAPDAHRTLKEEEPLREPLKTESSAGVRACEAPRLFGEEAPKIVSGEIVTFRNDVEQAMDAFNETADKFVKWRSCKLLVQKRTEAIRKTLKEIGGLARWREALELAEESEFLTSAPPRQGEHKNWRVSIDWFAKPQTIAGILEGKYSQGNGRNLTLGGTTESMLEGLARGYQREMEG